MLCSDCRTQISDKAVICIHCGVPTGVSWPAAKSRLGYILLGLFLGIFGAHNFYAGYIPKAVTQLLITVLIGWLVFPLFLPLLIVLIWAIMDICTVTKDGSGKPFTT